MGQAKQRGTFEERKAQAVERSRGAIRYPPPALNMLGRAKRAALMLASVLASLG